MGVVEVAVHWSEQDFLGLVWEKEGVFEGRHYQYSSFEIA